MTPWDRREAHQPETAAVLSTEPPPLLELPPRTEPRGSVLRRRPGGPTAVSGPGAVSALLLLAGCAAAGEVAVRRPAAVPTDTGLLTVLPLTYWLSVGLLLAGMTVAVWSARPRQWLAAAHACALVVVLYGVGMLASPYPRGNVPWRHVGVAAELSTTRAIDPTIDAYFGWPGFFSLLASYTGLAGLEDGQALMRWAPVANQLLTLTALLVLLRALTRDVRLVWSAVTLFYLANWVDQDYLAPQATAYFLYLVAVGLLLTFFRRPPAEPDTTGRDPVRQAVAAVLRLVRGAGHDHDPVGPGPAPPSGQLDVVLLTVLLVAAVVSMHQLTPFALLLAFGALAVARRIPVRGLPLITGVLIVFWLTYSATAYLQGNLGTLLDGVGDVVGAAQGGLVERIQGSPGHLQVVRGRLLFSLLIWALAGLAIVVHYLRGRRDTTAVLLMASPGLLFAMQSYGGEMLLRIFLFSLPFACFLAVQLLPSARTDLRRRAAGGLFLAGTLLLAPASTLVHYGNQLIDQQSHAEVEAVAELYRLAPPGSLLVAGNDDTPWRYTEYGEHRHVTLESLLKEDAPADVAGVEQALSTRLATYDSGALLLLTRQHETFERVFGRRTPYSVADVRRRLERSGAFTVVYRNADAVILEPRTAR